MTSRFTLDSKDSTARKYMAERADLLGAIRLPNNAFRANAGTDVVSDIIFLQKRDRPADIEPTWVQLGQTEEGLTQKIANSPMNIRTEQPKVSPYSAPYHWNIENPELNFEYKISW